MGENGDGSLTISEEGTKLVHKIAKEENFENIHLDITEASSKGDNYLGRLLRVKITEDNNNKFISLVVKNAPEYKILREHFPIGLLYSREIFAYSKLLPTMCALQDKHRIPDKDKFKYVKYYDSVQIVEKELLILEDLNVKGYRMYDRHDPFDQQHLELVIRNMARYHALSFVLKKVDPALFEHFSLNVARGVDVYGTEGEKMVNLCKDNCMKTIVDPELRRRAEEFFGNAYEKFGSFFVPEKAEPYNIICHGDCWNNNFLFKYEDDRLAEMRFVDWQIIKYASPITDIAYSLFSSTDEQMRANHYTNILDLYYETLSRNVYLMDCNISECYPKNVYEDQIKNFMPSGLVAAVLLLPIILANKEDAPDMSVDPKEVDEDTYKNLITQSCKDRLNGVLKDSLAYGFI